MPRIFLSPSTQEFNLYLTEGSEEFWMNLIADAMEPYLLASGISFTRNDPDKPLSDAIAQSNAGSYDLHLALHSNASPESLAGKLRGVDAYYYETSARSRRAAQTLADNIKQVYPLPELVKTVPTTSLAELSQTRAPAVLMELGYHDNVQDEAWIRENIAPIAENLVQGLTLYFGIPFVQPEPVRYGVVTTQQTPLMLRNYPSWTPTSSPASPRARDCRFTAPWATGMWCFTRDLEAMSTVGILRLSNEIHVVFKQAEP